MLFVKWATLNSDEWLIFLKKNWEKILRFYSVEDRRTLNRGVEKLAGSQKPMILGGGEVES